ncbi:DnaJ domain-containing protein [Oleispirillum naphthae]|uniref:DnaJ domain-containing protein n=1 Tax=Oleispirillum naphthae TaxID=2838853 RepID=UPI0030822D03
MAKGDIDPKNYYGILGVPPEADAEAIKAAFRARAKRLHPDHNGHPNAEAQFRLLNEAYHVLGDPSTRQRYHEASARKKPLPKSPPPPPPPPPRPEEAPREPPPKARFFSCRACGTRSAQPRVVIFQEVGGRPLHPTRRSVSGVFCPRCAQDAAIRASLHTWVRGMTALPQGPLWAFPALVRNLLGGEMPVEPNARMLLSQARAFLGNGDVELARASIVQALPFAARTAFRHEAETLLASLGGMPKKTLKGRWRRFGRAFWVQAAPFAAVVLIVALAMGLSLRREAAPPPEPASKSLVALPSGPNTPLPGFVTLRDGIALRGGPGAGTPVLARIAKGAKVTMVAIVPGENWVRVRLPDGKEGFLPLDDLQ